MRRLSALLLGIVLGGGLVFFAFHYHVVRAAEGHLCVRREQTSLVDPYVDVRAWDASDWQGHPELIQALVKHGRADLVVQPTTGDLLHDFFEKFGPSSLRPSDARKK